MTKVEQQHNEERMSHITNRFVLTKQLQAVVQAVVESALDSNEIFVAFGSAGITLHPVIIQNILERRAAQAQRS